jgi:hypothetical protein
METVYTGDHGRMKKKNENGGEIKKFCKQTEKIIRNRSNSLQPI